MVRLNKNQLTPKQTKDLLFQLAKMISPKENLRTTSVLHELLGDEEQIMIAKRLATIILLAEGYSTYKISHLLKLSKSTVANISQKMEKGEYQTVLRCLGKTKKNYFAILEAIDSILHLGGILPHYNGLDRYRF